MIKRVTVRHFKRFDDETFELSDNIVLAGPNNSGKTTLLQAVAVWNLAFRKWIVERGPESKSRARKRTGVPITRKDFTAIPLRELNLLWTDCSTALKKDELQGGQKPGFPRLLEIDVEGRTNDRSWSQTFEFRYHSSELIYVRPADLRSLEENLNFLLSFQVVHVPPFSGIGAEETRYDRPYQDLLVGQGKPGDILRNLLLEVHEKGGSEWDELRKEAEEILRWTLLPPEYEGRPFILCEYVPKVPDSNRGRGGLPRLDISCAGSGVHQVLTLFGFLYARPASVLLLDEPDAHLHVVLQKLVYDRLRELARRRNCQLLIATHAEVLIDGTSPERILSFYGDPHRLQSDTERDQVREALKRLTSMDLLRAEQAAGILYVEAEEDLNLLREWARVLRHPAHEFLRKRPFWHSNQGRNPREAKGHFFALQAIQPGTRGVLLLDGDNRNLPDHELSAEGLEILRWERYEAESYLVHPDALGRFVLGTEPDLFANERAEKGRQYLQEELPPAVYRNPTADHHYLKVTPASKTLLPGFFNAAQMDLPRSEYYQIATQMHDDEIPPEVKQKLDLIYAALAMPGSKDAP